MFSVASDYCCLVLWCCLDDVTPSDCYLLTSYDPRPMMLLRCPMTSYPRASGSPSRLAVSSSTTRTCYFTTNYHTQVIYRLLYRHTKQRCNSSGSCNQGGRTAPRPRPGRRWEGARPRRRRPARCPRPGPPPGARVGRGSPPRRPSRAPCCRGRRSC